MALSACSVDTIDDTDVNQEKFYGDYRVTFEQGESQVRHFVQFRVGGSTGTTIRLTEGKLENDGNEMAVYDGDEAFLNLSGTYYHQSASAEMPNATYTYTWTRGDGQRFENVATMPLSFVVASPTTGNIVPIGRDLTISLTGDPLGANESYHVELSTDSAMGPTQVAQHTDTGTEVTISADEINRLTPGPARLRVVRTRSEPTQSGHTDAGGIIETRYEYGVIDLELEIEQPVG